MIKVITPTGEVIGELVSEDNASLVVDTDMGQLTIKKGIGVYTEPYTDASSYRVGTFLKVPTADGWAIYMKSGPNMWVLAGQESTSTYPSQGRSDAFVTTGEQITYDEFMSLVNS